MSRRKEPMRKIKEVLRLAYLDALSERQIARGANMKKTTVHEYLERARQSSLTWADVKALDDDAIGGLLFPEGEAPARSKALPDFPRIHTELRRKHVTLQLLWEEYRWQHPQGYGYSRFCELYQNFRGTVDLSMRQTHIAGDKVFVDYSGDGVEVVDRLTGEVRRAQIFVGVLGASSYCYVEATWSQNLPDWIGSHVRMLRFFGGVPAAIVPDNLKTGVRKACYYDPEINPTYQSFAEHYGVAILPARLARPKDKAKVEAGVLLVQRWILARLRNRTFFSLVELNDAIAELVVILNRRPFKKMSGSRQSFFERLDKPALRELPALPFEYPDWKKATVNVDYHVCFEDHFYSVPCRLVREPVMLRVTGTLVEIQHRGQRVAVHPRSHQRYGYSTIPGHMPAAHRWQSEWTPARLIEWGRKHGAHIADIFEGIMERKAHPEQGFRACLGIMRLGRKVGDERLNAACGRAREIGGLSYRCVRNILENGQENAPLERMPPGPEFQHENVRGADYYRFVRGEEYQAEEERHAAASHY
jgi:transposase